MRILRFDRPAIGFSRAQFSATPRSASALAHGESAPNQEGATEHGLKCPILLLNGREEGGAFETEGTPVAYLVDEEGRVAAPVARGADRVLALALELAGPQPPAHGTEEVAAARHGDVDTPHSADTPQPHRLRLPRFLLKYEIGLGDLIKRITSRSRNQTVRWVRTSRCDA